VKYEVKIKKLPKSELELEVSLPVDLLVGARKKALEMYGLSIEIPGFRKGHTPENMIVEKVGETKILEEIADIILREHFPKIIEQEKLDIIGRPKISITKLAMGNPLEFKAVFAFLPEIEMVDYKKIAKEIGESEESKDEKFEASEKEVEDVLLQIRKNKAKFDKTETLPELNDEFAKSAGKFQNVEELKEKVRQNIIEDKKIKKIERKRALIMEALLKETKIDLPDILIESEIEKSLAQMKDDIVRMGSKFDDYLTHIKKTEQDLKKDLREGSEKKAKVQLIFNKIAEVEKLEPTKEILENEVKEVLKHYPEAKEESARIYVTTILKNAEVIKLLESF